MTWLTCLLKKKNIIYSTLKLCGQIQPCDNFDQGLSNMRHGIQTLAANHANIENMYSPKWESRFPTQSRFKSETIWLFKATFLDF